MTNVSKRPCHRFNIVVSKRIGGSSLLKLVRTCRYLYRHSGTFLPYWHMTKYWHIGKDQYRGIGKIPISARLKQLKIITCHLQDFFAVKNIFYCFIKFLSHNIIILRRSQRWQNLDQNWLKLANWLRSHIPAWQIIILKNDGHFKFISCPRSFLVLQNRKTWQHGLRRQAILQQTSMLTYCLKSREIVSKVGKGDNIDTLD